MQKVRAILFFVPTLALMACGSSQSAPENPEGVSCPAGQRFDGQYCQVDQNVASAETPLPPEAKVNELEPPPDAEPSQEVGAESGEPEAGSSPEEGAAAVGAITPAVGEEEAPPKAEQASPVDITMAAQAAPVIRYLASSHLPSGAAQFGAPFAGQFSEGQILEQKLQVTAGRCYTVVAVAMSPITELNVELFEEGSEQPLLADALKGTQAVLGSRGTCYKPTENASLRLVLTVERGNGVAAAQVFQK